MDPSPVTPTLLKLTRLRAVNAYLVREDDGFTLVDSLIPGSADQIIDAARRAGGEIRRLAFTHGHMDHVGSLDALKQKLPGAQVLMPETDAKILAGELPKPKKGGFPKLSTRPDILLSAGDRVGSLEVVPAPGHSPGHIAFLDTRDRAVIAGDVFTSIGGLTVTNHFHLAFPLAYMGTADPAQDLASARTLRALEPSVLVVGHGGPVPDPGAAMEKAIAAAG
jgi:glyoxylase-like metal-dependent hydrolase (beta-lactamase superfamily II)